MPIKVAFTDDHLMVLDGLSTALSDDPDLEITGVYQSGAELLAHIPTTPPDILLLDLQLSDTTGQEVALQLVREQPAIKIIILTGIESPVVIRDMMKAGCKGYLLKTTADKNLLIQAIKSVHAGELFLEPSLQQRLLQDVLATEHNMLSASKKLTTRETEILKLIVREYTNQQIAEQLFISMKTVENHRHNLLQKLDVKNAIGLVKAAMKMGLMD